MKYHSDHSRVFFFNSACPLLNAEVPINVMQVFLTWLDGNVPRNFETMQNIALCAYVA
jgi:hypothetical protein